MAKVGVNFDNAYLPAWFGGGLCAEFETKMERTADETAKFIGPIMLDETTAFGRALQNIANWSSELDDAQYKTLSKDLATYNPFLHNLKNATWTRREQFYQVAKFVCQECPVFDECRDFGISNTAPANGLYGGLDSEERSSIQLAQRRRAQSKHVAA